MHVHLLVLLRKFNCFYIILLKSDATEPISNYCPVVASSLTLTEVFIVTAFAN